MSATLDAERKHAAERESLLRQGEQQLRDSFRALSSDALRENAESFLQLARGTLDEARQASTTDLEGRQRAIGEMLGPIREALERVDGNLRHVEVARAGAYESLLTQVASLADAHQELSGRTRHLVDALKSPVVRGRWGEMQLRRVCELAQMEAHVDFVEQGSVGGREGTLRPDLQVLLPGGKVVIVDAKAPLQAYLEALEAPDDAARDALMRQHARQVRDHITRLSAKAYWEQFPQAPEFVVMFLPGETFFSAALQYDPTLIEYGVERRVVPASPTTLIALLRAVGYGWQQERVSRSAEEVRALGRELHDRLRSFAYAPRRDARGAREGGGCLQPECRLAGAEGDAAGAPLSRPGGGVGERIADAGADRSHAARGGEPGRRASTVRRVRRRGVRRRWRLTRPATPRCGAPLVAHGRYVGDRVALGE